MTDLVLGIRCHVVEVLMLQEVLVLMDDVEGKRYELPLPSLIGKEALELLQHGDAVWLSVRTEKRERTP